MHSAQLPSRRERPVSIVVPPFIPEERMTVDDPKPPFDLL